MRYRFPKFIKSRNQKRAEAEREKRTKEQSTENAAALNGLKQAYVDAHKNDENRERWKAFREYFSIFLLIVTVVITGLTFCVFWAQLLVSENAVIDAHRDADTALKQAHRDSDAALAAAIAAAEGQHSDTQAALIKADVANGTAKDTENRQLRAYVYARPGPVTGFTDTTVAESEIPVFNSGQSPAYDETTRVSISVRDYPMRKDFDFSYTKPVDGTPSKTIINPSPGDNAGMRASSVLPYSADAINAVKAGTHRVYIWGTIWYRDAFKTRHKTNFCFTYGGQGPTLINTAYCDRHNDAS